jgi:hypothetical protein
MKWAILFEESGLGDSDTGGGRHPCIGVSDNAVSLRINHLLVVVAGGPRRI